MDWKVLENESNLLLWSTLSNLILSREQSPILTTSSAVFPANYKVQRKDRDRNGGGVFVAYKDDSDATEVTGVGKKYELTMIRFKSEKSPPVYFGSFYRVPNRNNSSLLSLRSDLEKLFKSRTIPRVILMGDFNLPSIDWKTNTICPNPQYDYLVNETMLDMTNDFFLDQLVMEPTRLDNTLDLLLTSSFFVVFLDFSDATGIWTSIRIGPAQYFLRCRCRCRW